MTILPAPVRRQHPTDAGGRARLAPAGATAKAIVPSDPTSTDPLMTFGTTAIVQAGVNTGSFTSLYIPQVIHAASFGIAAPLDSYYMYNSTDHGGGGIYLLTAPSPEGPWTYRKQVFNDTTAGTQTETPSLVFDPILRRINLYYQQAGVPTAGLQSTLLATSTDGETFTRFGIVMQPAQVVSTPVAEHTGYQQVRRQGGLFRSEGLGRGSAYSAQTSWVSDNGETWVEDPRGRANAGDVSSAPGSIKVGIAQPFYWHDRPWGCTSLTAYDNSGATTTAGAKIAIVPMSADFRIPTGRALEYEPPGDQLRGVHLFSDPVSGRTYIYVSTNDLIYVGTVS